MLIPEQDEMIIEKAIYLPMLVTILNRDLKVIANSQFKIKEPYIHLVEETLKTIQKDLSEVKKYMYSNKIKVEKLGAEGTFTKYLVIHQGNETIRTFFNPVLKRRSEELLEEY